MQRMFLVMCVMLIFGSCNVNTRSEGNGKTDTVYIEKELSRSTPPPVKDEGAGKTTEEPTEPAGASEFADISGTHDLTLQWISWDKPGKAIIKKTGPDRYTISGSQTGNGQKLEIDGTLKTITPLELEFDGTIAILSTVSKEAEPCIKKGKQTFLSTKGRKYWRLQNMANCAGGGVVDYVDIYF